MRYFLLLVAGIGLTVWSMFYFVQKDDVKIHPLADPTLWQSVYEFDHQEWLLTCKSKGFDGVETAELGASFFVRCTNFTN